MADFPRPDCTLSQIAQRGLGLGAVGDDWHHMWFLLNHSGSKFERRSSTKPHLLPRGRSHVHWIRCWCCCGIPRTLSHLWGNVCSFLSILDMSWCEFSVGLTSNSYGDFQANCSRREKSALFGVPNRVFPRHQGWDSNRLRWPSGDKAPSWFIGIQVRKRWSD